MLSPPNYPWQVRALNGLGKGFRSLGVELLPLKPSALMEKAARKAGLNDFAEDARFREALELLCRSAKEDARLTLVGRMTLRELIIIRLITRLRMIQAQKQEPGISQTPLEAPLIVIGLPRSGTTLLHHLLALDPEARPLLFWELAEPIPGPGPDLRRESLQRILNGISMMAPEMNTKHHFSADNPEECTLLLDPSFVSSTFWVYAPLYGYFDWFRKQDQDAPYGVYRWFLQYFQRGSPGRRLTLKAPAHTGNIAELLKAIPNARIVHIHRDLVDVVPSMNSLLYSLHLMVTDKPDVRRLVEANMSQLEFVLERNAAARARGAPVLDVQYDELLRDPVGTVRRIHQHFHLAWDDARAERIRTFMLERPKDKHGPHVYSAEDFGISAAAIRERFARYIPFPPGS